MGEQWAKDLKAWMEANPMTEQDNELPDVIHVWHVNDDKKTYGGWSVDHFEHQMYRKDGVNKTEHDAEVERLSKLCLEGVDALAAKEQECADYIEGLRLVTEKHEKLLKIASNPQCSNEYIGNLFRELSNL